MAHVNLLKQVEIDDRWVLRSIPKKANGQRDCSALPDGNYFIEFREKGKRRRLPAGATVAQALEVQRRKHAELEAVAFGIIVPRPRTEDLPKPVPIEGLIDRYLDQIETLKKPNTFRKYNAVLKRFAKHFAGRTLDAVSVEDLNDFIVTLKKGGISPNTVLHNTIIIAQFCKRNGRPGITRQVHLPERISSLPREYTQEELAKFLGACNDAEVALFSTFLLTGFREQEVMYLGWPDVNQRLRTIRVTAKPDLGFFPKRWEERKVPVPVRLANILDRHPQTSGSVFMFPSPTGNREQNMLRLCKAVAERAGLDPAAFYLKTFRSTYATRMLRQGFDVRTVQDWMGHKSLETTMRYLVPATDVHDRLDEIEIMFDDGKCRIAVLTTFHCVHQAHAGVGWDRETELHHTVTQLLLWMRAFNNGPLAAISFHRLARSHHPANSGGFTGFILETDFGGSKRCHSHEQRVLEIVPEAMADRNWITVVREPRRHEQVLSIVVHVHPPQS